MSPVGVVKHHEAAGTDEAGAGVQEVRRVIPGPSALSTTTTSRSPSANWVSVAGVFANADVHERNVRAVRGVESPTEMLRPVGAGLQADNAADAVRPPEGRIAGAELEHFRIGTDSSLARRDRGPDHPRARRRLRAPEPMTEAAHEPRNGPKREQVTALGVKACLSAAARSGEASKSVQIVGHTVRGEACGWT
jgi:hypothetical protein